MYLQFYRKFRLIGNGCNYIFTITAFITIANPINDVWLVSSPILVILFLQKQIRKFHPNYRPSYVTPLVLPVLSVYYVIVPRTCCPANGVDYIILFLFITHTLCSSACCAMLDNPDCSVPLPAPGAAVDQAISGNQQINRHYIKQQAHAQPTINLTLLTEPSDGNYTHHSPA